jgi:hypothetical protein
MSVLPMKYSHWFRTYGTGALFLMVEAPKFHIPAVQIRKFKFEIPIGCPGLAEVRLG